MKYIRGKFVSGALLNFQKYIVDLHKRIDCFEVKPRSPIDARIAKRRGLRPLNAGERLLLRQLIKAKNADRHRRLSRLKQQLEECT